MKGVILAGGSGSRLYPCTRVTNKHLLPIFSKPMVYYPLQTLIDAGIRDILIVSGKEHAGDFLKLLGSGKEFGVNLTYELQEEAGGIAQALSLAEDFVGNEKFVVVLGDNIIEDNVKEHYERFRDSDLGAMIFLKEVPDAKRFGVAELDGDKVKGIEEKPEKPKTNLAVTGIYMFDPGVFGVIRKLKPSGRGEYEITDVNNEYIRNGKMGFHVLKGFWSDAGTFHTLHRASVWVREREAEG